MSESRPSARGFAQLKVVSFESRRATEMAELIRRHGGEPRSAPAMREVPIDQNLAAVEYIRDLEAGRIDVVIFMTGVGLRTLVDAVADSLPREQVAAALQRARLVARGPKPVAALREIGLHPTVVVPPPNTWREILESLDTELPVAGLRVAVQEYGMSNLPLLDALRERGAEVRSIAIYRWALPEDLGPLRSSVAAILAGDVDVALFTSATQVYHLFQVAGADAPPLRVAMARMVIASIGPVCSEALRAHGLEPDVEPERGKMGQLVAAAAALARSLVVRKRADGATHP